MNNTYQGMSEKVREVAIMGGNVHFAEHQEHEENHLSMSEFDSLEAQLGAEWCGDYFSEWILTDRDVWIKNTMYQGPSDPMFHPMYDTPPISEWTAAERKEYDEYLEALSAYEAHITMAHELQDRYSK